jgi:hypothetical protein
MLLTVIIPVVTSATPVIITMMMIVSSVVLVVVGTVIVRTIAMVMVISMVMHGVPVASSVVRENRGTVCLLNHVRGPTPENDRDAALAVLLVLRKGINSMLPVDVNVSSKRKEHPIGLWEIYFFTSLSI